MRKLISASLVAVMLAASPAFAQDDSGGAATSGNAASGGAASGGVQNGIQNGTLNSTTPGVTGAETGTDQDRTTVALLVLGALGTAGLIAWAASSSGNHGSPASP